MRVCYTGEEYLIHSVPCPRVPFLIDNEMREVTAANWFLEEIANVEGITADSPGTWKTYAEHLCSFFAHLEEIGVKWYEVTETHIAVWRNKQRKNGWGKRKKKCKVSTVNQRVATVCRFYSWALEKGLIAKLPFRRKTLRIPGGGAAGGWGGRKTKNSLTLQDFDRPIRIISEDQFPIVRQALGKGWIQPCSRLMSEAGLRREEAARLSVLVIPDCGSCQPGDRVRMYLDPEGTRTKGDKFRWVEMPADLAAELFQYKTVVRPRLAALYRMRHGEEPDELFLNRYGEPVSLKGINNRFSEASKKTGIDCSPHILRHTWATLELLRKLDEGFGPSLALFWLRDRMGHVSIATTQRYVHLLFEAGRDALLRHQDAITEMLTGTSI